MTNVTGAALGPALRPIPAAFNASWDTPTLYRAVFTLGPGDLPLRDSFLDMRGWGKGFVALNGFVLGRYWYLGPEHSLYVPAGALRAGANELIVFEADGVGAGCGAGAMGEPPHATLGDAHLRDVDGRSAPSLNAIGGAAVRARLEARARSGSAGLPGPMRSRGGCPASDTLPVRPGSGAPFVTLREVPVRDLPAY